MKTKLWYDHWLLPKLELMSGVLDGKGKRWNDIPVGNNPTAMPLDNSLNQDLHTAVQQHCILTQDLDDEDPRKFSTSTPKRTAEAYKRIWKYVPSSERIIQDINKTDKIFYNSRG